MKKLITKSGRKLVLRYFFVAGLTFVSYFISLYLVNDVLKLFYLIAITLANVVALGIQFTMNRMFTFRMAGTGFGRQLSKYALTVFVNYLLQIFVVYILFDVVGIDFYLSAFVAAVVNFVIGFSLQHNWVFEGHSGMTNKETKL